jgi:tRNA threonylcarbamoyladenosine biosynthesis protein TsaB
MPSSPLLLALTTATDACGVALWHDGGLVAEMTVHLPRRHGARLAPLIRDALAHSGGLDAQDLDAVALTAGPGSYTGLRIGASTAKGLCAATDAALAPVPTLEALAEAGRRPGCVAPGCVAPGDVLGAVLRSRRGEVYAAAFRLQADGPADDALTPVFEAEALETDEAAQRFEALRRDDDAPSGAIWLLGSGAGRVAGALPEEDAFRLRADALPTAAAVARLGVARGAAGTVADAAAFEPRYLKDFHATPRPGSVFE